MNFQRFRLAINLHLDGNVTLSSVCAEFLKNSGIPNILHHSSLTSEFIVKNKFDSHLSLFWLTQLQKYVKEGYRKW